MPVIFIWYKFQAKRYPFGATAENYFFGDFIIEIQALLFKAHRLKPAVRSIIAPINAAAFRTTNTKPLVKLSRNKQ